VIELSKLNGDGIYINEYWIEAVESLPDTTITLNSGNKIVVLEPMQTVLNKMIEWQVKIQKAMEKKCRRPATKGR